MSCGTDGSCRPRYMPGMTWIRCAPWHVHGPWREVRDDPAHRSGGTVSLPAGSLRNGPVREAPQVLRKFAAFAVEQGAVHVTTELFLHWKERCGSANRQSWAGWLTHVRVFARWLQTLEPATEVPPYGLIPASRNRPRPCIYTIMEERGKICRGAAAAIRLLMFTGCRRNEIVSLQWQDVDLAAGEIRLREAKAGPRPVALSPPAMEVLESLSGTRDPNNPWVIESPLKSGCRLGNLNHYWLMVRERAGLQDVRIHNLRHSFASRALALGESLPMIGKLLGHRKVQTTARYAHLAQESVKTAAMRVADSLEADLAGNRPHVRPVHGR